MGNKRKKITISKTKRRESMIKKGRSSEVCSRSMEIVLQETEQQKDVVMLDHSQPMETVMQATDQQQRKMFMLVHSRSMEKVMQVTGLLLEILSWLPVKSLLRFMCVSKQWNALISSNSFRKLHREKHTSSPPLLVASYNTFRFDKNQSDTYTYLITLDFFNGNLVEKVTVPIALKKFSMVTPPYQAKLLCFVNQQLKQYYLYNPSTRQSFLLTNPSRFSPPEIEHHCSADYGYTSRTRRSPRLANTSRFSRHYSTDYAYIPSKDEYIMVHLVKLSNRKLVCEVLENISISNDNFKLHYSEWRSSSEAPIIICKVFGCAVFVGGVFYWQALTNIDPTDGCILSFDVEKDKFSTFAYPEDRFSNEAKLFELNNEVYLSYCPESPSVLVMWKLSFDTKLWTRYWKFDIGSLLGCRRLSLRDRFHKWIEFIYNLRYLKGYEGLSCDKLVSPDEVVSAKMGELYMEVEDVEDMEDEEDEEDEEDDYSDYKMPIWSTAAAHTNMLTL